MPSFVSKLKNFLSSSSYKKSDLDKNADQYPGIKQNEDNTLDVRIGLDFGTAFTKVIVRVANDFHAISFKKFETSHEFLLPSILYLDENNVCHLGGNNKKISFEGLKDHIIHDEIKKLLADEEALASIIFFIALVLQHSRYSFLMNHWKQFHKRYIKWNLNIGIPVATHSSIEKKELYEQITKLAWGVSLEEGPIMFDSNKLGTTDFFEEEIGIFPECGAFLLSVEKSNVYRQGHYILIDIGAGTTDLSYLVVYDADDEIIHAVHNSSVEKYGTVMFMKYLLEKTESNFSWSRHDNFPELDVLSKELTTENENLEYYKKEFIDKYHNQLSKTFQEAFSHFGPGDRDSLERGRLRFSYIITGGGSNIDAYFERTELFSQNLKRFNLSKLDLPKPPNLKPESISKKDFQRLAVAYGLAWDPLDLAETIEYKKTPSGENNTNWRERYVGPEQM